MTVAERAPAALHPFGRLEALFDPGSLHVIRSEVTSWRMGAAARAGDGVIGAAGRVNGRPVFAYSQDASYAGGSLGEQHADTIVRVLQLAGQARAPVVGFVASAGARMQEGVAALAGYGRIFNEHVRLSGRVPQISVIAGTSAGGGSYSPALTDFVVMTRDSAMFLTGPGVVREVMGEDVDAAALGGPRVHERNGVCHTVVADDYAAAEHVRHLLSFFGQHAGDEAPPTPPAGPRPGSPGDVVPADPRKVYDVRDVLARVLDGGDLLEIQPRWARNLVTGFARLDGRAVGVIANQPRWIGGVLDADSAQKGARFVRTCTTFGLPLLVFVDTPGFLPGTGQEQAGVIRHGATLLHAFAAATVPKLTVVLRKAFGGAYITMNSRALGAHLAFAWPGAQLGVMGARQAVGIIHRHRPQDHDALAAAYAEQHLGARVAAAEGHIDEIIDPADTRGHLIWGLSSL